VSEAVSDVLAARGIDAPFQIQALVIPEALRGGDVLAKSPTGSGKTLAFAIPIVQRAGRGTPFALVLVPTRELCAQVTLEFALIAGDDLKVASVYGGVPLKAQANEAKSAHVIVATPGRLQDLVDRGLVSLDTVEVLVLDEADRMLDMGFKPQVDKLLRKLREDRQTMFFSATLDGEVGELARRYTHFAARFEGELPADRRSGDVDHRFVPVTHSDKVETLVELLRLDEEMLALVSSSWEAFAGELGQPSLRFADHPRREVDRRHSVAGSDQPFGHEPVRATDLEHVCARTDHSPRLTHQVDEEASDGHRE